MNEVYMDKGSAGSHEKGGYGEHGAKYGDENMKEDHEMVFQQLSNIKANVCALMSACQHGAEQITEAWVQSKVTLANDYIDTVHSYVINGGHNKHESSPDGASFVIAIEKAVSGMES
jgi:hypothetical protein